MNSNSNPNSKLGKTQEVSRSQLNQDNSNNSKQESSTGFRFDPNANYALKMVNIHKSFSNGLIKANVGINLFVKENSIHAIIGENGAGKSTLMSILFGMYEADVGEIWIRNQKVNFKSSKDAAKFKIGMVHQHFKLVDNFTVLDNIILGSESANKIGFLNKRKDRKKIVDLIKKYDFGIDVNQKVSQLTVGQQQKVEILKVLFRDSEIVIFDEPTAVLSDKEIIAFLEIVKQFKKEGKTIIIISHKLHEIKAVASEATVIRKGVYVDTIDVASTDVNEMAELMVGRKVVHSINNSPCQRTNVVLDIKNLNLNYLPPIEQWFKRLENFVKGSFYKLKNETTKLIVRSKEKTISKSETKNEDFELRESLVSFKIHAGEIYAIAGIEGNGQLKLVELISGLRKANKDSIIYMGKDITTLSVKKRIQKGISHVPEDRHKYGLNLEQSVRLNTVANLIDKKPFSSYGFIVEYAIADYTNQIIRKYDIRGSANGTAFAKSLSGGNQQKVIVGREIEKKHKLIILDQPTRGLDVGAVEFIHSQVLQEKANGNAVLLVSYELDDILALADTIAVISRDKIIDAGDRQKMTRQYIGNLLAGERI